MKITIDRENKTAQVPTGHSLTDIIQELSALVGEDEWGEYIIEIEQPTFTFPYSPDNPYPYTPWPYVTYTDNGGTYTDNGEIGETFTVGSS